MNTSFSIDYEWLPSTHGDESERWTLADLAISVGSWCGTEVEDVRAKTVRSSARLSALHLAEWFAANWWRLLWEPRSETYAWRASHRIGNAGHGFIWPDLSFNSDWQSVHVSSRPTASWEAEPIRYLNDFDQFVPIRDFEVGVGDFIDGTIARLSSIQTSQTNLSLLWNEVTRERNDPESFEVRMLEACMGYDPDEAPQSLLVALQQHMGSLGSKAIAEIAAAHKGEAISHMMDLRGSTSRNGVLVQVPRWAHIRDRIMAETDHSAMPWQRAEQAAKIARDVWDLSPPIPTARFCDLLGISQHGFLEDQTTAAWGPFIAGFRDATLSDGFSISLNRKYGASRRFDLVRILADHLVAEEEDVLLPGTHSRTSRQKFQRAFAQEFLCPSDALLEHVTDDFPNSDDVFDASQYFGVSPMVVLTTLVNKGVMGRESLDSWIR